MTAPEPLVSIILPVYNRSHLLIETIQSVLSQTYSNYELIVIDDGSTDDSARFIEESSKKDSRISYFHQKNRGPAGARNRGMELAKGEFIAFLDSDDLWTPDKLKKQMTIFDNNPEIGFIYCSGFYVDEKGEINERLTRETQPRQLASPKDILLRRVQFFSTSGVIVKKMCLLKAGTFDEKLKFLEDYDLWFRILLQCKPYLLDEQLVMNLEHPGNYINSVEYATVEFCRSDFQRRTKAVQLFEQAGHSLTREEREQSLYHYHRLLIKEYIAYGFKDEARKEIRSYLKTHPFSIFGFFTLLLSAIPAGIVSKGILWRRSGLRKTKEMDQLERDR